MNFLKIKCAKGSSPEEGKSALSIPARIPVVSVSLPKSSVLLLLFLSMRKSLPQVLTGSVSLQGVWYSRALFCAPDHGSLSQG